jgi:hypothetical protein
MTSCRNISRRTNGNRTHLSSISKGLNISLNIFFITIFSFFNLKASFHFVIIGYFDEEIDEEKM